MLGRVRSNIYTQVRGAVNFFTKRYVGESGRVGMAVHSPGSYDFSFCRREDELWKTVTSVTNAGRKKGRLGNRQKARPLAPYYSIGRSGSLSLHP